MNHSYHRFSLCEPDHRLNRVLVFRIVREGDDRSDETPLLESPFQTLCNEPADDSSGHDPGWRAARGHGPVSNLKKILNRRVESGQKLQPGVHGLLGMESPSGRSPS